MIRCYEKEDINNIILLGNKLHDNYKFQLDIFSNCIVYEENNIILGFITYSIMYERAEIIDIIVDEKYRIKGIGKALIKEVINNCISNNCNNITLEVNCNNDAIKFYQTLGFNIVSTRKSYYDNEDAYLMELKLEVK